MTRWFSYLDAAVRYLQLYPRFVAWLNSESGMEVEERFYGKVLGEEDLETLRAIALVM